MREGAEVESEEARGLDFALAATGKNLSTLHLLRDGGKTSSNLSLMLDLIILDVLSAGKEKKDDSDSKAGSNSQEIS